MMSYASLECRVQLLPKDDVPLCYSARYESILFCPEINTLDGRNIIRKNKEGNASFNKVFANELTNAVCIFTDGSKTEGLLLLQDSLLLFLTVLSRKNLERQALCFCTVWNQWLSWPL